MCRSSGQFIALLMLLWLPLFSASALAASVTMQMQPDTCHEAAMQTMSHADMDGHMHHDGASAAPDNDGAGLSCDACDICHLAYTGYLTALGVELVAVRASAQKAVPYQDSFRSFTSAPLVRPPLARA